MRAVVWAIIFSMLTGCMMRVVLTEADDQNQPKKTSGAK